MTRNFTPAPDFPTFAVGWRTAGRPASGPRLLTTSTLREDYAARPHVAWPAHGRLAGVGESRDAIKPTSPSVPAAIDAVMDIPVAAWISSSSTPSRRDGVDDEEIMLGLPRDTGKHATVQTLGTRDSGLNFGGHRNSLCEKGKRGL